ARKREDLLAATETLLAKVQAAVDAGRLADPDKIGLRAGKVIDRYKVAKHFTLDISHGHLAWQRNQAAIDAEAALDGIYVIRTPIPASQLSAVAAVTAYKNLSGVERDFRTLKDDLDLRPIWHRLEDRVRGHVLICMLAAYLTSHLRQAPAPPPPPRRPPPRADTPRPPPPRPPPPRPPGPPAMPAPTATRCAPSAACSTTSPPSPGQPSSSAASPSTRSANPPQTSAGRSTSSA